MAGEPRADFATRFQPGNPGRPKGARSKLKEDFFKALADTFREHGRAAMEQMIENEPAAYIKVIASLMPKQMSDEDDNVVTPPILVIKAWEPGDEGGEG